MEETIILGMISSLMANGVQGVWNGLNNDEIQNTLYDMLDKVRREFEKHYPELKGSNSALSRQENLDIMMKWLSNENILSTPRLNEEHFDGSIITEEQKAYLFERIQYHVKNSDALRNYCMYEMIKASSEQIKDINLIKGNTLLAKMLINKINETDILFKSYFSECSIWRQSVNFDSTNLIFTDQTNSLDMIFFHLNMLIRNLNKEKFDETSKKCHQDEIEAFVYLLKNNFQDKSVKVGYLYNNLMRHINVILKNSSCKNKDYYISLGRIQIESGEGDSIIYIKVMNGIIEFFSQIIAVLRVALQSRKGDLYDSQVIEGTHKIFLSDIKRFVNKDNAKYIKTIYDSKKVTDIDLAKIYKIDVEQLRNELYSATRDIVSYSYSNVNETLLSINNFYIKTIEAFYDEIFEKEFLS